MDFNGKDSRPGETRKTSSQQPRRERVRIVVADDDPSFLHQICILLETDFDLVARVANGRELVEAVAQFTPELVITDITMPELDGIEAAYRITSTYPHIRVVV